MQSRKKRKEQLFGIKYRLEKFHDKLSKDFLHLVSSVIESSCPKKNKLLSTFTGAITPVVCQMKSIIFPTNNTAKKIPTTLTRIFKPNTHSPLEERERFCRKKTERPWRGLRVPPVIFDASSVGKFTHRKLKTWKTVATESRTV